MRTDKTHKTADSKTLDFRERKYLISEEKNIDIDEELLRNNRIRAHPLNYDHIDKRDNPFRVEVLRTSVDFFTEKMINLDAFVAIELIEHLFPPELERLPYNVFHLIRPQVAIFTTPNSDFNTLFASLPFNNMRHDDHKFEWSREQFRDWAQNIVERFPNYMVSVQQIGPGPDGAEEYGGCSQAAIFVKIQDSPAVNLWEVQEYNEGSRMGGCDIITECDYPYDMRSREEKISDNAMYHINQIEHRTRRDRDVLKEDEDEDYDYSPFRLEISLDKIQQCIAIENPATIQELEYILKGRGLNVDNGNVIIVSDDEDMEDFDNEDIENF